MTDASTTSASKGFIAGGVAGMSMVITCHPLDTLKVRMQTGESQSIIRYLTNMLKNEGPRSVYKGMTAPLAGITPIFALSFYGYNVGKLIQMKDENSILSFSQIFAAGVISGIYSTVLMAPGERIKCLLQVQQSSKQKIYNGPIDCAKKLYKQGGIRSVYKGTGATLLRDLPASGVYFSSYEYLKYLFTPTGTSGKDLSSSRTLMAGGIAGMLNWTVCMPPDVAKSIYQTAPEGKYKGLYSVFTEIMKKDGLKGFYRGATAVYLRAFPANAVFHD
ncbi:Solute carrier family 25 member 48 [Intoshia linei]|uniref:Solute carrier family 25 member 48 n=1 Tax=Intoshia linei TaxID=1819745 RepID=A0A177B1H6_9BILA|nr:Solute carrier family 25 member 48 [Intoshia linei]